MIDLTGLKNAGEKSAPVETPAATPAPVEVAPAPEAAPVVTPAVQSAPVVPVPVQKPSSVPEPPYGAIPLFDRDGKYVAIRKPDNTYITVTSEAPADPLSGLSAADKEPINWEQEKQLYSPSGDALPQRTPGRIQFLLTQETEAQTTARIINDTHRGLLSRTATTRDPETSANAAEVKRFVQ